MIAAYGTIDLTALKHNLEKVSEFAPNAKVMAVIKANAYGHGLLAIAKGLGNIDALAVARVEEGIRLRNDGIKRRITVLEGFVDKQELANLISYDLDIVVHSLGQINILEAYRGDKQITAWLKIDTGMNRLGFKSTQFDSVYQRLSACSKVTQPFFLMSHLSSADELDNSVTAQQISIFQKLVKSTQSEKSIANSAGILAWKDSILDWVRPGIMLYGVSPFSDKTGKDIGLKPVMTLYSRLISVKDIECGESVGYSGTWISKKKTRLGVVAIGYGDGYPRYAKNGTPVLVNGKRVSLVGRVSMDMITVDLNTQPNAKAGDRVTLWGNGLPVEEIAQYANTIPYTLLCGVTQRVNLKTITSK